MQHVEKLTPEQVKFDVLVLFHLCGDLMQPLHVGYGSDKGGNTYQVQYKHITLASLEATGTQKLKQIDFMAWLNESRALLPQVYIEGHKLDDAYMQKNKVVIETQLRDGGALLTACLETLFSKVANVPAGSIHSCSIGCPAACKAQGFYRYDYP